VPCFVSPASISRVQIDNLDLAMMRFMEDWFPKESRIKAKENEKEVADELAEELGLVITGGSGGTSGDDGCLLM